MPNETNEIHIAPLTNTAYAVSSLKDDTHVLVVAGQLWEVSNGTVELIHRLYSDDGEGCTIAELSDQLGVDAAFTRKLIGALKLTHGSDVIAKHEYTQKSEADLLEERLKIERDAIRAKSTRAEEKYLVRDAKRWRQAKEKFHLLTEGLAAAPPSPVPEVLFSNVLSPLKFSLMLPITDFHYGKLGTPSGNEMYPYNRYVCTNLLWKKLDKIVADARRFGTPEFIFLPFGSDWFHVDNVAKTTTKGTPQDTDTNYNEILVGGTQLFISVVEKLRKYAKHGIRLIYMPGNHDEQATHSLYLSLWQRFKNDPHVIIEDPTKEGAFQKMQFFNYGDTAIFTHHGDRMQPTSKKSLGEFIGFLTSDRNRGQSFNNVCVFTGDKHHDKSENIGTVQWEQTPTLCGNDKYHGDHLYGTTKRALAGYIIESDKGIVCNLVAPALAREYTELWNQSIR